VRLLVFISHIYTELLRTLLSTQSMKYANTVNKRCEFMLGKPLWVELADTFTTEKIHILCLSFISVFMHNTFSHNMTQFNQQDLNEADFSDRVCLIWVKPWGEVVNVCQWVCSWMRLWWTFQFSICSWF